MSYFTDWLALRGLSDEDVAMIRAGYCSYDTDTYFLGEKEYLSKLYEVYQKKLPITICPDYDADGIMAGVLFYSALSELGFERVHCYYPSQVLGYGLTISSAQAILDQYPDTQVVLTCDNGIHSDEAVAFFKEKGVVTLVTDHHPSMSFPDADACVDPCYSKDEYPFKGVSGATVLWKVLCHYAKEYYPEKYENILKLAVFAGISAVTDSMPMIEENRNLVRVAYNTIRSLWTCSNGGESFPRENLEGFSDISIRAFEGLYGVLKVISENGGRLSEVDEMFFGFTLGPMLNAARRIELGSESAFRVFIENDECTAYEAASYLFYLNQERKNLVAPLSAQAILNSEIELATGVLQDISPSSCIFCYGAEGCLGLIANALTTHTGYPSVCFALSEDNYAEVSDNVFVAENNCVLSFLTSEFVSGSARAPSWFDFYAFMEWFESVYPEVVYFGGHSQAGAFTVRIDHLGIFSNALLMFAKNLYQSLPEGETLPPYDMLVSMGDDSKDRSNTIYLESEHDADWVYFANMLDTLKPFGPGFLKPVFRVAVDISSKDVKVQYMSGGKHFKCSFDGFDFICWNGGFSFAAEEPVTFFADTTLGINEFKGKQTVTFYANGFSASNVDADNIFESDITLLFE